MDFYKKFTCSYSIVIKQLIVVVTINLSILFILDVVQNKNLTARLSKNIETQLHGLAEEHRRGFDAYAQSINHAVKLIITQQRFTDYIDSYNLADNSTLNNIHFAANPPAWLPSSSVLRSFYKARIAVLISPENTLVSAYYHRTKKRSDSNIYQQTKDLLLQLNSKYLLRKWSRNQFYLTELNNRPYIISTQFVKNHDADRFILILINPLDNKFLADVLSEYYHKGRGITLLINSDSNEVISSSEPDRIKPGDNVNNYSQQYLLAGDSFFDYGASDLRIHFTSVIPLTDVNKTFKEEIYESRKEKFFLAAVLTIAFIIITYMLVFRIKNLTEYIQKLQQSKFSSDESLQQPTLFFKGDEIRYLYKQFDLLINNIEQNQNNLQTEIKERKSKEKQLAISMLKADKANLAKSEFLSSMSHELRTPLNAILGFSQLLSYDQSLNKLQRSNVQKIYDSGYYLLSLIDDVLDLSRIEKGKLSLNIEPIDINQLLLECQHLTNAMAEKEKVKIYYDSKELITENILLDHKRLKQVVLNLLSNAIKYIHSHEPIIWLTCKIENRQLFIDVKDNGRGIDKKKIKKLFVPYNRLGAEKGNIEGTGIGLVISKQLITMMGGTISVQSLIGEGTTFQICIPLKGDNFD
ncbi:MAG: ATP-binding protein [Pseudomonadota bacterium]